MTDLQSQFAEAAERHRTGDRAGARTDFIAITKVHPGCHEAHYMLGVLAMEQNSPEEAEQAFRHAESLDRNNPEYLFRLAGSLLALRRPEEAIEVLDRVLELTDDAAPIQALLGEACLAAFDRDRAVAAFERACTLDPDQPGLRLKLASALRRSARLDDARAVLEQATRQWPRDLGMLVQLASVLERLNLLNEADAIIRRAIKFNPRDAGVMMVAGQIAQRQQKTSLAKDLLERSLALSQSSSERRTVHHELGLLHDRIGDVERAMEHIAASKRAISELPEAQRHSVEGAAWLFEACRSLDARRVAAWTCPAPERRPPIFFIGFPRSGTTLVEQMLGAHEQIVTLDEVPALHHVAERFISTVASPEAFLNALDALTAVQISELRHLYWREVQRRVPPARDAEVVVDKHPMNTWQLWMVRRLYPEARVLMAVRDPRDVCLSCFMNLSRTPQAVVRFQTLQSTASFYADVMTLYQHCAAEFALPLQEYRYEDLVADPAGTLRQIMDFLELPYSESQLQYHTGTTGKAILSPSYQGVQEAVHNRAVERWRRYEAHFGAALETLEPFVRHWNYAPSAMPG